MSRIQATFTSVSIGKAAAYTLTNWDRLTRFVDDPTRAFRSTTTLLSVGFADQS